MFGLFYVRFHVHEGRHVSAFCVRRQDFRTSVCSPFVNAVFVWVVDLCAVPGICRVLARLGFVVRPLILSTG